MTYQWTWINWPEADTKVQRLPKEGLWKLFVDLGCASLKIGELLGKVLVTVIFYVMVRCVFDESSFKSC